MFARDLWPRGRTLSAIPASQDRQQVRLPPASFLLTTRRASRDRAAATPTEGGVAQPGTIW